MAYTDYGLYVQRADGACIPKDAANIDYAAFLAWVQAGGVPVAPSQQAAPPTVLSMRQARLALLGAGKLSYVDAAIDALPSPQKEAARIEWEYASEVRRDNALLQALAPGLGLTAAALDALFVAGAAL